MRVMKTYTPFFPSAIRIPHSAILQSLFHPLPALRVQCAQIGDVVAISLHVNEGNTSGQWRLHILLRMAQQEGHFTTIGVNAPLGQVEFIATG